LKNADMAVSRASQMKDRREQEQARGHEWARRSEAK